MSSPTRNGHPDPDPDGDFGRVAADDACPRCGEDQRDLLVWIGDDRVRCFSCGTVFQPGGGAPQPLEEIAMPAVFCFEPAGFAVAWRGAQRQRHRVPWVDFWAILQALRSGPERQTVPALATATNFKAWKIHAVLRWLTRIGATTKPAKGV
jgi:hypothetical protein